LFHRRFVGFNICSAGSGSCNRSIPFLIADYFFLKQIERALFVRICFDLVSFVFCQGSLRLRQCGFVRARINFEKGIAFFHYAAFGIITRNDVALHLRVDVGVDETIECRHAFKDTRHILRLHGCHQHFRRRRSSLRRLARTTSRE
jgi:hypothetical protein